MPALSPFHDAPGAVSPHFGQEADGFIFQHVANFDAAFSLLCMLERILYVGTQDMDGQIPLFLVDAVVKVKRAVEGNGVGE